MLGDLGQARSGLGAKKVSKGLLHCLKVLTELDLMAFTKALVTLRGKLSFTLV